MSAAARLDAAARAQGLRVLGTCAPAQGEGVPASVGTVALLGPDGDGMWAAFRAGPEADDGRPDPLDRWSRRVVGALAEAAGGVALFPFDGPPWPPFLRWALRSGRAWASPIGPLVHEAVGLWVSYRGAVGLPEPAPPAPEGARPCDGCPAPCRTACPVAAFGPAGYDAAACRRHVAAPEGTECRERGCLARRVCPASLVAAPSAERAAFHMAAFVAAGP